MSPSPLPLPLPFTLPDTLNFLAKRANSSAITNAGQAGVFSGVKINEYNSANPITLFIIQLFIIIVFTQTLGWAFRYLRQPSVIAEIVGGVILGPTIMGRIPNFSNSIFPTASLPYLNLVSTIGLIIFLFLVGLEVDLSVVKRDWKAGAGISAAGMVIPFGAGAGLAVAVYNEFADTATVSFGNYVLFVGTAVSITAFPVLCRILTETKLLDTKVGQIVLSAGVGNDIVGWVLLALTIALANANSGVTVVYVLLCAVGWAIAVLWPIKKAFLWLCRRSGSFDSENGPTQGVMLVMLLLVFTSAFITDIIGVHPIFGGFLAGLIIPHEHQFAVKVTERLEELIALIFLPIYFVLSGLKTNLGLLDNGITWGYVFLIITVAFFSKFLGCAGAASLVGFSKRESLAVGTLMSCKGLVELIVLNVGYSAGILDQRTFSMFVLEAIVLTFITTPLTLWVYPAKYHTVDRAYAKKPADETLEGGEKAKGTAAPGENGVRGFTSRFMVVLQKMEHLSAIMLLTQLLEPTSPMPVGPKIVVASPESNSLKVDETSEEGSQQDLSRIPTHLSFGANGQLHTPVSIEALKLVELTGRTHSVMQSIETEQMAKTDDLLQLYKQFGGLRGMNISTSVNVVPLDQYTDSVISHAHKTSAELLIIPWTTPGGGASAAVMEERSSLPSGSRLAMPNPFEHIFGGDSDSGLYSHYIRRVFLDAPTDVALLIDRGFGATEIGIAGGQHIFLPYFGGVDDQLALATVVQLCQRPNVTATVVRYEAASAEEIQMPDLALQHTISTHDTKFAPAQIEEKVKEHQDALNANHLPAAQTMRKQSQITAEETVRDAQAWDYYTATTGVLRPEPVQNALSRISFSTIRTSQPLGTLIQTSIEAMEKANVVSWRPLLVVVGRGRAGPASTHGTELARILTLTNQNPVVSAEIRKTVGDVTTALAVSGTKAASASFLVVQAAPTESS